MKNIFCNKIKFSILVLTVFTLNACSFNSLSTQQCISGDWYSIGYNDGSLGYSNNRINNHQQACSEAGVIPNFKQWEEGRQQGLKENYCTEHNAYQLGISGHNFNYVCSIELTKKLEPIYLKAHHKYITKKEILEMKQTLSKYKTELKKLRRGEMLNFKTEREARSYMLDLQRDIFLLKNKILKKEQSLND